MVIMIRGACKRLCDIAQRTMSIQNSYGTAQIASLQKAALQERCILVDKLDRPIGEATKKFCHEINAEGSLPLHRAFSVFLFNDKKELLLQKRSSTKVSSCINKLLYIIIIIYNYIKLFIIIYREKYIYIYD